MRASLPLLLALGALLAVGGGGRPAAGARILALFQLNAKSHFVMFEPLLKALAGRGHRVDVLSHFPQPAAVPNYRDLSLKGTLPDLVNNFTADVALNLGNPLAALWFFWVENLRICEVAFEQPAVRELLRSNGTYDLVITELFGVDCMMGFGHKFQAPVINMISSVALPWANARVGNPDHPGYIPVYFLPLSPPLSFPQRLANAATLLLLRLGCYLAGDLPTDRLARRFFGPALPPLAELKRNVSLVLVNSHWSMHQPRPTVPAMVEVGGLHIGPPRPLPAELQRFLDGAEHGAVFFSLGSLVRSETLATAQLSALLRVFGELPQRVLWKCNSTGLPRLPANVLTGGWLPQADVLGHPKVRVFVTHGGLMGSQEALHHGVPMVGLPFFGDQHLNMDNYVRRGVALKLDPRSFTEEQLRSALRTVLSDPGFRQRARSLSARFRDRQRPPLETAVWWTEYVLRHRGAPHLRSAAADLGWAQLLLLDVGAALAAAAATALAALWLAGRLLLRLCSRLCSRPPRSRKAKVS